MSKKAKIIVSISGIVLVMLILLGLTYAYFLTRINGNTNTKSISVKTANLALVYGDGNGVLEVGEVLSPGDTVKFKTAGGDTVDKKTFSVTNQGNAKTDYVVVIEDVKVTYTATVVVDGETHTAGTSTTFASNDFVYTLTCTSGCNGVDKDTTFPINGGILVGNSIDVGEEQTYELRMTYLETGIDQSSDMNKTMTARVNIKDISTINPYSSSTNSLAYNIINNAITGATGTTLSSVPETNVAVEISGSDETILSVAQDDYGTSYYFRGNVEDNYVTFADMCWRIVRINGDGSTKLILEDQDQPCSEDINGNWDIPTTTGGTTKTGNFGYTQYAKETLTASDGTTKNSNARYLMDYLHGQTSTDRSMATAFKNFQSTFTETELSKLKSGNWCLNDTAYDSSNNLLNSTQIMDNKIKGTSFNYDSLVRLYNNSPKQPTLKCPAETMGKFGDNTTPMYVGTLTADEIVYAGGKVYTLNQNYYLINNYQKSNSKYFWSLSPYRFTGYFDRAFYVNVDGNLNGDNVNNNYSFRPSVSLASSAVITSGEGTLEKPYVIG